MASENEKTVFGVPGLPLESGDAPPVDKPVAPGEKTMVGLSFADDEMAQLEAAIESVEQRATEGEEPPAKPSTPRAAPLPPPRARGATVPSANVEPAAAPPANGTVLMTVADFGDLDAMLSGNESATGSPTESIAAQADEGATRLFDADEVGDAISGVFDLVTSGLRADAVEERLAAPAETDEVDDAFAATEVISSDARIAALAALDAEQKEASKKADVRAAAPAPKQEPPATAAGTLLMSAELIEQAAAAAVAAARPAAPPPRPAPVKPAEPPPAAANATLFLAPDAAVPDSSATRRALAAAEISDGKTEIPAPEKTKRYQTGAAQRVEARPQPRDSVRRQAPLRAAPRSETPASEPVRRDGAALWVAGIVTVLVLGAIAWFLLR